MRFHDIEPNKKANIVHETYSKDLISQIDSIKKPSKGKGNH